MRDRLRSLVALDWINFLLADVETGVGPFMATYFSAVRHWDPAQIGVILASQKIASVVAQAPAGWIIDRSRRKVWLLVGASLAIALGSLLIVIAPDVTAQVANQVGVGISTALATPLIPAISLGIVGRHLLARRIGRNESFNHFGNLVTALVAGWIGYSIGQQWIFYVCAVSGLACAVVALAIPRNQIDDQVARQAPESASTQSLLTPGEALSQPLVLRFACAVVLFHIANAAMLPLAGEELSARNPRWSSAYMSGSIVLAQLVMIPVAWASGRLANRLGRKPILLLAFAALVLRGVLFSVAAHPLSIVAVEALDGIGTGIAGVITVLVISDLAKGTGRFNFLSGTMQACLSIGSFLGNLAAGLAAKRFSFPLTFLSLALVALSGLVYFMLFMPETVERQPD